MEKEIWAGESGNEMHKHEFDGPWIDGKSCLDCPPPLGTITVGSVDLVNKVITFIPEKK